jgi:glycosyltransferase involved in cell wall biosynthesis
MAELRIGEPVMSFSPYLSLILPAYNEVRSIRQTLYKTRRYLDRQHFSYELIVAADGDDGTREAAREEATGDQRVVVIGESGRHGKGRGIRLGVQRSCGEIVGFADADYKTPIEELEKILPWFQQGYEVVIGSRAVEESKIENPQPFYRRLGSRTFNVIMRTLIGLWHIPDTQCGFKFFRGPIAHDLFRRQRIDGYIFDVEILYLAHQCGYRLKQVGVRWRDDGDSRLALLSGNWRNLVDLFRIRFGKYRAPETVADGVLCSNSREAA